LSRHFVKVVPVVDLSVMGICQWPGAYGPSPHWHPRLKPQVLWASCFSSESAWVLVTSESTSSNGTLTRTCTGQLRLRGSGVHTQAAAVLSTTVTLALYGTGM
jgi:hypothetical protein